MVKVVVITMIVSLLAIAFSGIVGWRIYMGLTFKDLNENFLLYIFTFTGLALLFVGGLLGFFLWPMCYGMDWVFDLIFSFFE